MVKRINRMNPGPEQPGDDSEGLTGEGREYFEGKEMTPGLDGQDAKNLTAKIG